MFYECYLSIFLKIINFEADELPAKGQSMRDFSPDRDSPAANNPAWTPPVAVGAPPMLPPGVSMNHGQDFKK